MEARPGWDLLVSLNVNREWYLRWSVTDSAISLETNQRCLHITCWMTTIYQSVKINYRVVVNQY